MTESLVYKIVPAGLWRQADATGAFTGSPVDVQDGFIHFSTASQLDDTARKHFTGQADLLLVTIDAGALGAAPHDLRWEPSRGGQLFPHLYGPLPVSAVRRVEPFEVPTGIHTDAHDQPPH